VLAFLPDVSRGRVRPWRWRSAPVYSGHSRGLRWQAMCTRLVAGERAVLRQIRPSWSSNSRFAAAAPISEAMVGPDIRLYVDRMVLFKAHMDWIGHSAPGTTASPLWLKLNPVYCRHSAMVPGITMLRAATFTISAPPRIWTRSHGSLGRPSGRRKAT
jgi:hypothetical protein